MPSMLPGPPGGGGGGYLVGREVCLRLVWDNSGGCMEGMACGSG